MLNAPLMSVTVSMFLPFTLTVTAGIPVPFLSFTVPDIFRVWASIAECNNKNAISRRTCLIMQFIL
jgi:hypothetical protein